MNSLPSSPTHHGPWQKSWPRLVIAGSAGIAAAVVLPISPVGLMQAIVGWDVGALTLLSLTWHFILRSPPERTRHAAAAEDPGRAAVGASVLVSSVVSLVAAAFVIDGAK